MTVSALPPLPTPSSDTTGGSVIRHAVTGAIGSVLATVISQYLALPPEYAIPLGTSAAGSIMGGMFRLWMKKR